MSDIFDILTLKYPGVSGIAYWERHPETGQSWKNPYDGLVWEVNGIPKPTEDQIAAWRVEYDLAYRQKLAIRKRVYPSIIDQLDMMYHDKMEGTTTWQDAITAVKEAYPRPVE